MLGTALYYFQIFFFYFLFALFQCLSGLFCTQYRYSKRLNCTESTADQEKWASGEMLNYLLLSFFLSHFIDLQNQTLRRKKNFCRLECFRDPAVRNKYLSNAQARLKTGRTPSIMGRQQDKSRSPSARHGAVCGEQMRGGRESTLIGGRG